MQTFHSSRGAPSKFTADVVSVLLAARRQGRSGAQCAGVAAVHRNTLVAWLRLGNRGVEPFAAFAKEYDTAYRTYQRAEIARIVAAMNATASGEGKAPDGLHRIAPEGVHENAT